MLCSYLLRKEEKETAHKRVWFLKKDIIQGPLIRIKGTVISLQASCQIRYRLYLPFLFQNLELVFRRCSQRSITFRDPVGKVGVLLRVLVETMFSLGAWLNNDQVVRGKLEQTIVACDLWLKFYEIINWCRHFVTSVP